jgi:hypothetical protein
MELIFVAFSDRKYLNFISSFKIKNLLPGTVVLLKIKIAFDASLCHFKYFFFEIVPPNV